MDKCNIRGYFESDKGPLEVSCNSTVPHEVHYFVLTNNSSSNVQHKNVFDKDK